MFARKLGLLVLEPDGEKPVPKPWLDQFFLRSFTGHSAFDHVLPVADGEIEAGFEVDAELARRELEQWLRGRKTIAPDARVLLRESEEK